MGNSQNWDSLNSKTSEQTGIKVDAYNDAYAIRTYTPVIMPENLLLPLPLKSR